MGSSWSPADMKNPSDCGTSVKSLGGNSSSRPIQMETEYGDGDVTCVAVSPNNRSIFSGGTKDKTILIHDSETWVGCILSVFWTLTCGLTWTLTHSPSSIMLIIIILHLLFSLPSWLVLAWQHVFPQMRGILLPNGRVQSVKSRSSLEATGIFSFLLSLSMRLYAFTTPDDHQTVIFLILKQ